MLSRIERIRILISMQHLTHDKLSRQNSTCNPWVLCSPAAITDSSSQSSHVVMKCHFSEHVKAMHEKRDYGFEKEFQVCLFIATDITHMSYEPCKFYQFHPFKWHPRESLFCRPLQLFLMVLWILPRLTQQRTDTTIFTPVSQRMLNYMTRIIRMLSWHVLLCVISLNDPHLGNDW